MSEKTLRVLRDRAGWTVEGDRHPRSYTEKAQAIQRAEAIARQEGPCRLTVLDEHGGIEEERTLGPGGELRRRGRL